MPMPIKKTAAKKAPSRKPAARKSPARKSATKKSPAARAPARKTVTRKASAKKTAVKKTAVKKTVPKKTVAKRAGPVRRKTAAPVDPRPVWVLDVPFDPAIRLAVSALGGRWDKTIGATVYRGEVLPEALVPFQPAPWSPLWHRQQALAPQPQPRTVSPKWTLRPHQTTGATAISAAWKAGYPGFLLADDVGLGKTLSAWGFALEQSWARRILIVSPLSVLAHWRNTLLHIGDGNREVWIVNYDSLGQLFEVPDDLSTRAKGKRARIAKKGEPPEFDLVIWDEAHKGKNPESARSTMMRRIGARARFSLWLSATAGQEPLELSYLSSILAKRTRTRIPEPTLKAFGEWCQAQGLGVEKGQFGHWNKTQDPQAKEAAARRIHDLLFEGTPPLALRRLPTDIAGWPELERQMRLVDLAPVHHRQMDEAWLAFRKEEALSPPPKARRKEDTSNALVRQLRLRQSSSLARLDSTMAVCEEMLDNGRQVAISVAFHETLSQLMAGLGKKGYRVCAIHGKMSAGERESERRRFQAGEADVVLFTVEEGISLHEGDSGVPGHEKAQPRVMLIHDLRWSALQMAQIEGRCHRDGRFAPVLWMMAPDTIDVQIAAIMSERVRTMKTLMGDDTETIAAIQAYLHGLSQQA